MALKKEYKLSTILYGYALKISFSVDVNNDL